MKAAILAVTSLALMFGAALSADAAPRNSVSRAKSATVVNDTGRTVSRHTVRRSPFNAYAHSPGGTILPTGPGGGYRWPYVKYDAEGNMIGPNPIQPDRW